MNETRTGKHWAEDQARRYIEARFGGPDVWFRAPETIENVLERWIWAVASGSKDFADGLMARIETALA